MFKNILIPTDGSDLSQKVAMQGVALAKSVHAKVTGFFAAPPATPSSIATTCRSGWLSLPSTRR